VKIEKIVVGQLETNCYVVTDRKSAESLIIDPGDEPDMIIERVDKAGLKPQYILFTHAHYDHVCATKELHDLYGAQIIMHKNELSVYEDTQKMCMSWGFEKEDFPEPDTIVQEGDVISVGTLQFKVLHTPGHTPGGICLFGEKSLFSGDTLFRGSVGRTDLKGGDFSLLSDSLKKLISLPGDTRVLCGHAAETTIDLELKSNPFLR